MRDRWLDVLRFFSKLFGFCCKGLQLVLESVGSRDVKRCQEASNLGQLRLSRCLFPAAFTFYARLRAGLHLWMRARALASANDALEMASIR